MIYIFIAMPSEIIFNRLLHVGASITSGNSAIKKEVFMAVGGFNEDIFYGLDTDIALRISKIGKVRFRYYFSVESSARRFKKKVCLG